MNYLQIILKWREKRIEEKKITENWQIALLLDYCKYFEKKKEKKHEIFKNF